MRYVIRGVAVGAFWIIVPIATQVHLPELPQFVALPHVQKPLFVNVTQYDGFVDGVAGLDIAFGKDAQHVEG